MLVLTRKSNETIHVGEAVVVTVVEVSGGRVRLGIEAARDLRIRRGERPVEPRRTEPKELVNELAEGAD